jgi:hypothetical protein
MRRRVRLHNHGACGNFDQFCNCGPNGKVTCGACVVIDAGAGGKADGGDGGLGLPMCPAGATNPNAACTMNGDRCPAEACANHRQNGCVCGAVGAGSTANWFCVPVGC